MFELIVSWLTNEQETSMNWAIRRWNDDSSGRGGILINLRKWVGCSTHHCPNVRTVSPTFIRRSDLDAVQDKNGFHYFVCIYKKDGRGPSVPIPPEANSHLFLQAPCLTCSAERDPFTISFAIFGWASIDSPFFSRNVRKSMSVSSNRITCIPRYLRTSRVAHYPVQFQQKINSL